MRQNQRAGREVRDYREGREETDTYNRRWYGADGDEQDDEGRVGRYDTRRPYDTRGGFDRERNESVYPYGGPRYSESSRRYEPAGDGNGGSGTWGRERDVEGWRSGPDSYTRPQSARESWGSTREGWADESYPGERHGERSRYERYGSGSRGGYSGAGDDRWSNSRSTSGGTYGGTYGVGGMQGGSSGMRGESGWNRPMWGNSSRYRSFEGMQSGEGTSFRGRGPKGYTRSDERIREEVNDRLTEDHSIDAGDIECTVQSGEVTLTGTVPDREMKRSVEDLVESLSGVKNVQNNLRVKKESSTSTSDRNESSSSTASRTSQTSNATTGYGSKSSR